MTLDKAIELYEFRANEHKRDAEYHRPLGYSHETIANVAEMRAREERQFAEWLKELKAYRETYPYGVDRFNGSDTPQKEEKHAICNGCVYCDLPNAFHPCASCVDFSKYVGEVSGDTPQTDCPWE